MKILFVNSFFRPDIGGGAELSLEIVAKRMAALGHEVAVIATTAPGTGVRREIVDGVSVYRVPIANIYWQFRKRLPNKLTRLLWHWNDRFNERMGRHIEDILVSEKPDVVSCHNLAGHSISAWRSAKRHSIPIVQVLHDFYLVCPSSGMIRGEKSCRFQCGTCKYFRRKALRESESVTSVIGVSGFILDRIKSAGYFSNAFCSVIYNARAAEPKAIPIRDRARTFGFIGSIIPRKGIEWLAEQFVKVGVGQLLIAGEGAQDYISELACFMEHQGVNFQFLGHVKPEDFFHKIDVLVVPSLWEEPLGVVAFEAAGRGIPVVASDRGGLREIVHHGVNGLLCNPHVPDSLSLAMLSLINDPQLYRSLSGNAPHSVKKFFDLRRLEREYEAAYRRATVRHVN